MLTLLIHEVSKHAIHPPSNFSFRMKNKKKTNKNGDFLTLPSKLNEWRKTFSSSFFYWHWKKTERKMQYVHIHISWMLKPLFCISLCPYHFHLWCSTFSECAFFLISFFWQRDTISINADKFLFLSFTFDKHIIT